MRGTTCDLLSEESVERAYGNVQQSVDTGQELRRPFMPKRETRGSRRMDEESQTWFRALCQSGECEAVTPMAETPKAPMCAEWVEEEEPVEGMRKGWPER